MSKDFKESKNLAKTSSYFKSLNERMKNRVLQIRMPDASAKRSWDNASVPSIEGISGLKKGLSIKSYLGSWDWVPEFTVMESERKESIEALSSDKLSDLVSAGGVLCEGYIKVPSTGQWTFVMQSNAKSFLRIHDKKAIDNDYNHSSDKLSVSMNLEAGYHPIRLYMVKAQDGNSQASLQWKSAHQSLKTVEIFSKPVSQ